MSKRFDPVPFNRIKAQKSQDFITLLHRLEDEILSVSPDRPSREISLALTHLEEVCMWTNRAIALSSIGELFVHPGAPAENAESVK